MAYLKEKAMYPVSGKIRWFLEKKYNQIKIDVYVQNN